MDTHTPDPDLLAGRVREMIGTGKLNAASAVLAAVRRLAPPGPAIAELTARLASRSGSGVCVSIAELLLSRQIRPPAPAPAPRARPCWAE